MNEILERKIIANNIKDILIEFDNKCRNPTYKKGIYIYGSPGSGKTLFVNNLLKELNYDVIQYDAGDVRNKMLIDTITCNNISDRNVLYMMKKEVKKIAIVMDEIDGMNNGDKGGITSLIKLIRQKKTKKQKLENVTLNPIICIGNYYVDKKIKELMKVCNCFELKTPTSLQIEKLLTTNNFNRNDAIFGKVIEYIQGDLRKYCFIKNIMSHKSNLLETSNIFETIFHLKTHNDDSKNLTKKLINEYVPIESHLKFMNETERTIVALLYHENIIDSLFRPISTDVKNEKRYQVYSNILENICYADYIDRITFQNQIWIFNEMSSLIKIFTNNRLYHNNFPEYKENFNPSEVRFTKVLTKYSTEYNNQLFLYYLCQQLDMDKKDLISFFQELRICHMSNDADLLEHIVKFFDGTSITRLDIKRMYRFLDKNVKVEDSLCFEEDD
jgi:dephospho-CoA kinase